MRLILGIDPGSRKTGYGIIAVKNSIFQHIVSGYINAESDTLRERLEKIFKGLSALVEEHRPHEVAIEQIFLHQNASSSLKLGEARGAAIVAATSSYVIPLAEYSARQVKQSVVGYGAAKKEQIQQMVKILLNLEMKLQSDAADALAIAICHANGMAYRELLKDKGIVTAVNAALKGKFRRGRIR